MKTLSHYVSLAEEHEYPSCFKLAPQPHTGIQGRFHLLRGDYNSNGDADDEADLDSFCDEGLSPSFTPHYAHHQTGEVTIENPSSIPLNKFHQYFCHSNSAVELNISHIRETDQEDEDESSH